MKVCVSSVGSNLEDEVDPRFGRCAYLLFVDSESGELLGAKSNETNVNAPRGAGISTAQVAADEGVRAIITGNVGPKAFDVFSASGIDVYPATGSVKEAVEALKEGNLNKLEVPTSSMGPRKGMGDGRGFGNRNQA